MQRKREREKGRNRKGPRVEDSGWGKEEGTGKIKAETGARIEQMKRKEINQMKI